MKVQFKPQKVWFITAPMHSFVHSCLAMAGRTSHNSAEFYLFGGEDEVNKLCSPDDMDDRDVLDPSCTSHKGVDNEYFIQRLIKKGHDIVLEHASLSVYIRTDRAMLAELTRHRLASYTVESTRYVNYKNGATFIIQEGMDAFAHNDYTIACYQSWQNYCDLMEKQGLTPEIARAVLPLGLSTHIYMTANIREWRHIIKMRTAEAAHPQMRALIGQVQTLFHNRYPILF
jgi:thymidylate synthase (FAD)